MTSGPPLAWHCAHHVWHLPPYSTEHHCPGGTFRPPGCTGGTTQDTFVIVLMWIHCPSGFRYCPHRGSLACPACQGHQEGHRHPEVSTPAPPPNEVFLRTGPHSGGSSPKSGAAPFFCQQGVPSRGEILGTFTLSTPSTTDTSSVGSTTSLTPHMLTSTSLCTWRTHTWTT